MKKGYGWVLLPAVLLSGCSTETAKAKDATTERKAIELTVYSDDFAMVREKRPVKLVQGANKVRIEEVSRQLDPSSVLFTWPAPEQAQVVSSTYDLGVGNGNGLLKRYLGQPVDMVWYGQDGREGSRETGTLQAVEDGGIVLQTKDRFLINPTGTVVAPTKPEVVTIPQLAASVESKANSDTDLSVAYLTRGLSWSTDYVATLAPDADDMNLECWATVTNLTGTTYPEAKITLVAGSPNRNAVPADQDAMDMSGFTRMRMKRATLTPAMPASAGIYLNKVAAPMSVGELYAYPIKAAATIVPDQMNRVRMLYSKHVQLKRDYSVTLPSYWEWSDSSQPQRQNAQLAIRFLNQKSSGLGLPLPQGSVRVYQPDANGSPTYIGASAIGDTPKDARANLTLTNVFDVTSESRLVKTKRLDRRHVRYDYEAVIRNAKTKPVQVRAVQSQYSQWKVVSESLPSTRPNAATAQWIVPVPAGGKKTLTYSVVVNS